MHPLHQASGQLGIMSVRVTLQPCSIDRVGSFLYQAAVDPKTPIDGSKDRPTDFMVRDSTGACL